MSVCEALIFPRLYRDSVTLMAMAARLEKLDGVRRVGAMMATPANLRILADSEMLPAGLTAAPDDLLVVVRADDADSTTRALAEAGAALTAAASEEHSSDGPVAPATIGEGLGGGFEACLATVSVPGAYAPAVVEQALRHDLHVFCFSDNVSVADEIRLKNLASRRRLLLMGPDCGTAIIDGVPLGFANVVRPGSVGIVAASGTGAQEVSVLLDAAGVGLAQLIGVGGRDLSEEVGGTMTWLTLDLLADDEAVERIVVVSKPPAAAVADRLRARLATMASPDFPAVACLLGLADEGVPGVDPVLIRGTLAGAAATVAELAGGRLNLPAAELPDVHASGPGVLGLYTGGTLASEAKVIARDAAASIELHDLGDDRYTAGKPHPMIDPSPRNAWIAGLTDPAVGVLLVDVVLGYGSHPDPAGQLVDALADAQQARRAAGVADLVAVASVTGTDADPQGRAGQVARLRAAGVIVAAANAVAVEAALTLAKEAR
jgi:FdrA protein